MDTENHNIYRKGRYNIEIDENELVCLNCTLPDCRPRSRCCVYLLGDKAQVYDGLTPQQRYDRKMIKDPVWREKRRKSQKAYREKQKGKHELQSN